MAITRSVKTQKQEKIIHFLGRTQFKANDIIFYRVQAEVNGVRHAVHTVTVFEGKVTGCMAEGEVCKGWQYQGTCCHSQWVAQAEAEHQIEEQIKSLQPIFVDEVDDPFFHPERDEAEVLFSTVCGHRVKFDIYRSCGCDA